MVLGYTLQKKKNVFINTNYYFFLDPNKLHMA